MVKCLPAMWETQVWSLGWEDPLEKELATHSNTLAWKIPWTAAHQASPSEGGQNENHNHRKLTNLITWTTALSNSMKLWAMPCRATQDRWVMVEKSDRMWSTGEGNGKPLQYSCLENPMNSVKRQKDRVLKDELPRSVGTQYATGDKWINNFRKNEETEPSKNNTQLWMWLVIEAKSDAVKSNIAKEPGMLVLWIKASWQQSYRRWQEWMSTF